MNQLGLGTLSSDGVRFSRKFRWLFSISELWTCPLTGTVHWKEIVKPIFVKVDARPNLKIEETEIDYLSSKSWIPGKQAWKEISATIFDHDSASEEMKSIYKLLKEMYDFSSEENKNKPFTRNLTGVLELLDGCGIPMETWHLNKMFVTSVNFGELDYSSSECITIDLRIRYESVNHTDHCKPPVQNIVINPPGTTPVNMGLGILGDVVFK